MPRRRFKRFTLLLNNKAGGSFWAPSDYITSSSPSPGLAATSFSLDWPHWPSPGVCHDMSRCVTECYDWASAMFTLETQNIGDTGQAAPRPWGRSLAVRPVAASEGCPWLRAERGWAQAPDSGPGLSRAGDESSLAPANTGGGLVTLMTRYPTWSQRGSKQLVNTPVHCLLFGQLWNGCLYGLVKLYAIDVLLNNL